eukprot:gene4309-6668_t
MGKLDIRVVEARNLHDLGTFTKSDPYCVVTCGGKKFKTTTKPNTLAPHWDEKFTFDVDGGAGAVVFEVRDDNTFSDESMGSFSLSISGLHRGKVHDDWYKLRDAKSGEVRVRAMAADFGIAGSPPPPAALPLPSAPPLTAAAVGCGPPAGAPPQNQRSQQQQQPGGQYPCPSSASQYAQGRSSAQPELTGKSKYKNEDIVNATVRNATINTCDIQDATLHNCQITKADFRGTVHLHDCKTREIDVYGRVILHGGKFEWGEVKPGGSLDNQGAKEDPFPICYAHPSPPRVKLDGNA